MHAVINIVFLFNAICVHHLHSMDSLQSSEVNKIRLSGIASSLN